MKIMEKINHISRFYIFLYLWQANKIKPSKMVKSCTVALADANLSKNHYWDVIPRKNCSLFICMDGINFWIFICHAELLI